MFSNYAQTYDKHTENHRLTNYVRRASVTANAEYVPCGIAAAAAGTEIAILARNNKFTSGLACYLHDTCSDRSSSVQICMTSLEPRITLGLTFGKCSAGLKGKKTCDNIIWVVFRQIIQRLIDERRVPFRCHRNVHLNASQCQRQMPLYTDQ